ncbi:MAG TPA: pyridoxal-phosphate dependent enzyme [Actinocrinis sp.]|nr:pyridoxal-phosphate dependent enzyme [Actinocrinis sp.]
MTEQLAVSRPDPPYPPPGQAVRGEAVFESVLDAVGHTPLIRLARLGAGLAAPVYVKAEFLGPGMSVKDRAALHMVLAAERAGDLRPGGVIVEGTSGNTGIGLAMVAAQRGYRLIVVVPDKVGPDKISALRAYGAEVLVTAAGVPAHDPKHVRNLARSISEQIPGAWMADQYDNAANPQAHRETTGPEIWRQTAGRITHFVACIGTGGTITGTGEFLKQASGGAVRVVGADPETSVYAGGDGSPYYVEAAGHYLHPDTIEDEWPQSYHPAVLDAVEPISDRESIDTLRRLAREEGMLVGGSAGTAIAAALRVARGLGPDDLVVVLAPDSGRAYLSKYFDDGWLLTNGFQDPDGTAPALADLIAAAGPARAVPVGATVAEASAVLGAGPAAGEPAAGGAGSVETAADRVALVVLARPSLVDTWAPGDVVGTVTAAALAGRAAEEAVRDLMQPPPATAGAGESPAAVADRVPADRDWVGVLVNGRIVSVVRRAVVAARAGTEQ